MSPVIVGIIGFLILFFLILVIRIPIGFGMIIVGFAGMVYLASFDAAISFLGHEAASCPSISCNLRATTSAQPLRSGIASGPADRRDCRSPPRRVGRYRHAGQAHSAGRLS